MANPVEDNVYPNDGRFYSPFAEDTKVDSETKQAEVNQDVLNKILERLDERIAFYDSVNSVPDEALTDPAKHMHYTASNKMTRNNLYMERNEIAILIESAKRG